jgi:hypothetical protein
MVSVPLASIGPEGVQLTYDYCCDKGSDIAMACGRRKESGKDKVGSTAGGHGGGTEPRNVCRLALLAMC